MLYDYVCTDCESCWEHEATIKDPPLAVCPFCNKQTAQRQISNNVNFILKDGGVGWYKDGYAPKSKNG